jgi:hypothetical protein
MSYPNRKYDVFLEKRNMNESFFRAVHHILKARSYDGMKVPLMKLFVNDDRICATNGHVLSWINTTPEIRKQFIDSSKINVAKNGLYTVMRSLQSSIHLEKSAYKLSDYPIVQDVIPDFSNYHTCSIIPGWSIKNDISLVKMALYNKKHDVTFTVIEKAYEPNSTIHYNDNPLDPVIFENHFGSFIVYSLFMPIRSDFNQIQYHDEKEM